MRHLNITAIRELRCSGEKTQFLKCCYGRIVIVMVKQNIRHAGISVTNFWPLCAVNKSFYVMIKKLFLYFAVEICGIRFLFEICEICNFTYLYA